MTASTSGSAALLEAAIAATNAFLNPVLDPQSRRNKPSSGAAVAERLLALPSPTEDTTTSTTDNETGMTTPTSSPAHPTTNPVHTAVSTALDLLTQTHTAVKTWDKTNGTENGTLGSILIRNVYCLLDIVIVMALYPLLLRHCTIPFDRRLKSVIFSPPTSQNEPIQSDQSPAQECALFYHALTTVVGIAGNREDGLGPLARDQALLDILAAATAAMLVPGFPAPPSSISTKATLATATASLIRISAISKILPTLTALVGPKSSPFTRPYLIAALGQVPIRPNGVRHIIEFVAMTYSQNSSNPRLTSSTANTNSASKSSSANNAANTLPLPLDALDQCAKLICAPPPPGTTQDTPTFFSSVAIQLLALLDKPDRDDLTTAAAFVANAGILSRRTVGGPGTVGWNILIQPIHRAFQPVVKGPITSAAVLVSGESLLLALQRLHALVTVRTNPSLTFRILNPVLLQVWALHCYAISSPSPSPAPEWADLTNQLLESYFRQIATLPVLIKLADNVGYDGEPGWVFAPASLSPGGLIQISPRSSSGKLPNAPSFAMINEIKAIQPRTNAFTTLIRSGAVTTNLMMQVFQHSITEWLMPASSKTGNSIIGPAEMFPLTQIAHAQLVEGILVHKRDMLEKNPVLLLTIVHNLLQYQLSERRKRADRRAGAGANKSLQSQLLLSSTQNIGSNASDDDDDDDTAGEILDLTLSLLMIALTEDESLGKKEIEKIKAETAELRMSTRSLLRSFPDDMPSSTRLTITNALRLLDQDEDRTTTLSSKNPKSQAAAAAIAAINRSSPPSDAITTAHTAILTKAKQDLTAPEPPVRAAAIHALLKLVNPVLSPVVDPTSLAVLFLHTISSDPEAYVSLAGTHAFAVLSRQCASANVSNVSIVSGASGASKGSSISSSTITTLAASMFSDPVQMVTLDGRLRIAEALVRALSPPQEHVDSKKLITSTADNGGQFDVPPPYQRRDIAIVADTAIAVAGRRGKRTKEGEDRVRSELARQVKMEEAVEAWGGEIPEHPLDMVDRLSAPQEGEENEGDENDGMSALDYELIERVISGWEQQSGTAEDIRIRTSAMALLSHVLCISLGVDDDEHSDEHYQNQIHHNHHNYYDRCLTSENTVSAALDLSVSILMLERAEDKAILRRAATRVIESVGRGWYVLGGEINRGAAVGMEMDGDSEDSAHGDAAKKKMGRLIGEIGRLDVDTTGAPKVTPSLDSATNANLISVSTTTSTTPARTSSTPSTTTASTVPNSAPATTNLSTDPTKIVIFKSVLSRKPELFRVLDWVAVTDDDEMVRTNAVDVLRNWGEREEGVVGEAVGRRKDSVGKVGKSVVRGLEGKVMGRSDEGNAIKGAEHEKKSVGSEGNDKRGKSILEIEGSDEDRFEGTAASLGSSRIMIEELD